MSVQHLLEAKRKAIELTKLDSVDVELLRHFVELEGMKLYCNGRSLLSIFNNTTSMAVCYDMEHKILYSVEFEYNRRVIGNDTKCWVYVYRKDPGGWSRSRFNTPYEGGGDIFAKCDLTKFISDIKSERLLDVSFAIPDLGKRDTLAVLQGAMRCVNTV